jgi:hypothetical protein
MDYLYHDWVIDGERVSRVQGLIHIANRLSIELRSTDFISEEGFIADRFFVQIASEELCRKFSEETKRIGFDRWVETTEEEFTKLVQYKSVALPNLNDISDYFLYKGYELPIRLNRNLKERWAEAKPTYIRFDWIPASPITQELAETVLRQTDFCLGCATRLGLAYQLASGLYAQPLLIRVLMPWEEERYQRRILELIQAENWSETSEEEYKSAQKIENDAPANLTKSINRLAKANAEIRSQKNSD